MKHKQSNTHITRPTRAFLNSSLSLRGWESAAVAAVRVLGRPSWVRGRPGPVLLGGKEDGSQERLRGRFKPLAVTPKKKKKKIWHFSCEHGPSFIIIPVAGVGKVGGGATAPLASEKVPPLPSPEVAVGWAEVGAGREEEGGSESSRKDGLVCCQEGFVRCCSVKRWGYFRNKLQFPLFSSNQGEAKRGNEARVWTGTSTFLDGSTVQRCTYTWERLFDWGAQFEIPHRVVSNFYNNYENLGGHMPPVPPTPPCLCLWWILYRGITKQQRHNSFHYIRICPLM